MTLDDVFPRTKVLVPPVMPSDRELRELAGDAGGAMQQIQNIAGRASLDAARVSFPRGYLVDIPRWRVAIPFVQSPSLRSSIADTLMMHDVQAWLLKRTDLAGHAKDMLVKACIASLGAVAEALLIDATTPPMGKRQKVASRVGRLQQEGVLSDSLASDLSWLWDVRNRQHLHGLAEREFNVYQLGDHARAEDSVAKLIQSLRQRSPA
jgi:hypothetical protein